MKNDIAVQDGEIAIAKRGVTTRCAIAAAIMTHVPAARYIKVDRNTISWLDVDRGERLVFKTPPPGCHVHRELGPGKRRRAVQFPADRLLFDRAASTENPEHADQDHPAEQGRQETRVPHDPDRAGW